MLITLSEYLHIVSSKLNVSRQRVQKEITKVTIKLVLVALQVLKAPTDFPPCPSPGSPPVLPRQALLLHSPPDPPGPLHYPRSPAQASAQASLPHGCWRARGSSAEEARSGSKGTQAVSRHTAELLCVPRLRNWHRGEQRGPGRHRGRAQWGRVPRAGPHPPQSWSSLTAPRQAHAPQASSSPETTEPSPRHPCHSQPVLSSPLSHPRPRQPSSRTTGARPRSRVQHSLSHRVRRLTPSQDLTATASQYPRAPRVASYPAPNPTTQSGLRDPHQLSISLLTSPRSCWLHASPNIRMLRWRWGLWEMNHHDGEASLEETPAGSAALFLCMVGGGGQEGCWFSSDTTSAGI